MAKKLKTSTKGYKKSSPDKNEPALRIPSGRITMKDVPFPVLGIDNYGNSVIMQPGEEYQFPGSEVIEMPVLQTGGRAPIYTSNPNDPRLRAYNDSGESLIPEGFNSPYKGDLKSFSPKVDVKKKEGQSKKIEQQKKVEKIISKQKTIGPTKQFISHHLEKKHEEDRLKKLEEYAATHPEVEVSPYGNLTTSSYGEFIQKYGKNLDKFAGSMETPLAIQGAGDLLYGVGKLGAKYLPQVGEYLTTQTPLKNTYKYNPWAFKPNPEAYYRRIGGDEGLDDLLTSGEVRASQIHHTKNLQGINLAKAHTEPYFSIGVPFDTRYGPKNQFYKGPYTLELKNHPMTGKVNGKLSRKANIGVPLEPVYLDNPNLKIYKEDWLKGYKEVPKPKSTFKSEIDWSKWNPEQGTATGYMKKGGLTPNKAREILHDGKVHGKKLTEKQRRFFGAMSKGHTKKYQIGGNLGKAAASASTTDEQLVLKKNEDYLKNIGLVHYANASRKPISSNFEYIPDFDESLQFIKNWYGSPEALDRMTKLVGKRTLAEKNMESAKENVENTFVFSDPERVKNIIKQYESRMTYAPESEKKQLYDELIRLDVNRISALEAKRDFYGDMIDKNKGFSAGFFNANGSIVNINEGLVKTASDFGHPLQKQSRETLKRTSVHELSHASGMDKLMKKFEPKPLHKSVKNAIEMGFVVPRIKELSKELEGKQPDRDYLESDTFYPRIMELRFIHGIKPGDTIDKKKLEEIKKNPKSAKNPLFRYYGDDDIIWMMNNLVKANNNSNTENTMKKGGIHIDPKNKGKFTKSAKAAGMGVQEFARHVLANKEDYSPTQVKRANFARNAKKWSAQEGFVVPSGETWQFDPITGEPMGAPEKWRNEDDPVTIPGLKEHLAKIKAGIPTNPFKTTGNEGSVQNPMGAGEPDNGPEKKPSKNYLPTLNAINFGLTKLAESLRNKELERYNRQMIALQNVPQPRRLTRIEQYGDPSVYQIGGMIPEDVSYLMGTIPNFDMLPTTAKSSSGMDNVVQGAIKGTTQQAKGTPVPGSDYENVIYNTYIENGLTPQAALFLTAQTMHETANYSSNVFKKNNNVGGIKIPKTRKSPYIEGVGTSAPANESKNQKMNKYAKYKDVKSGAMDLLEWMKYNKIDPNKFNTPEEYAIALYNKSYYHEVTGVKGAETKEAAINTYSSSLKRKIEKLKKKGFEKGGEYDLSDSEIAELKAQGYDIEIID